MKPVTLAKNLPSPERGLTWITVAAGLLFVCIGLSHWHDTWQQFTGDREEFNLRYHDIHHSKLGILPHFREILKVRNREL